MSKQHIVTINGKSYDSLTGLPIPTTAKTIASSSKHIPATGIHTSLQKSQTLNRRAAKKPFTHAAAQVSRKVGQTMDIARSRSISRFAPHQTPSQPMQKSVVSADIAPRPHPLVHKATQSKPTAVSSAQTIKQEAITKALAMSSPAVKKHSFFRRHPRAFTTTSIIVVLVLILGCILYLNIPTISVKIASAQAGIAASYPNYIPDGYSLNGPVTYTNGHVAINFAANTGSTKFTITQAKSSWDSTAVLTNVVNATVGQQYLTTQDNGLTIYTYSGGAAWVNAGILYTITGNAPLSGDQVGSIATSM